MTDIFDEALKITEESVAAQVEAEDYCVEEGACLVTWWFDVEKPEGERCPGREACAPRVRRRAQAPLEARRRGSADDDSGAGERATVVYAAPLGGRPR